MRNKSTTNGLMSDVIRTLNGLDNIDEVVCSGVRRYHGAKKVHIPDRWPTPRQLPVVVCDGDLGEREIVIHTSKAGAIARILSRRLAERGVTVVK